MQTTELIELAVALVVITLIVLVLRRSATKSRAAAGTSARERLGYEEEAPQQRRRRRPKAPEGETDEQREAREAREAAEDRKAEEEVPETDADTAAAYKAGLAKTRGGFVAKLGKIFGKKQIDAATVDELEEILFTADIGPRAADRMFQAVKSGLSKTELEDPDKVWKQLRKASREILAVDAPPLDLSKHKPFVLLVLGVNGVGKTTTIGKLAAKWKGEGKRVLLAAGDTFRAAATEQLEEWAKRAGVEIVKGKPNGDPSSVIFEAVKKGVDDGYDIVICDTAGRLHSNSGLMDELKKIRRVTDKAMPGAPHETWMVLDATTGQNAISQAKTFKSDMEISGIVLTKLDGSSKGGVVLGICDELQVPVRFVGLGEKIGDLRPFDPNAFVDKLLEKPDVSEAA
jgi:fused signal recognition particle receptor